MAYVKVTYKYGEFIEVMKHHSSRYGDHRKRETKTETTTESAQKANDRRKREQLTRILKANFVEGDAHVVLTYKEELSEEETKKELKKFFRKLRREMGRREKELKYLYVTEKGKRKGRIHHHMVLNTSDLAMLRKCWTAGQIRATALYPDKDYEKLADYLTKTLENKKTGEKITQAYVGSKNLIIPKPEREVVKANSWKEEPKPTKGYLVVKDSIKTGINGDGYPWQSYMMVAAEAVIPERGRAKWMERWADRYIMGKGVKR